MIKSIEKHITNTALFTCALVLELKQVATIAQTQFFFLGGGGFSLAEHYWRISASELMQKNKIHLISKDF